MRTSRMEEVTRKIENMQISNPKEFWNLFKTKGGQGGAGATELHGHYRRLLMDETQPQIIEQDGYRRLWEEDQ